MKKSDRVPVTMKALVQRINRKLADSNEALRKTRGARALIDLGDWYVLDTNRNLILHKNVDPEVLGRELGVLHPWEVSAEEDGR